MPKKRIHFTDAEYGRYVRILDMSAGLEPSKRIEYIEEQIKKLPKGFWKVKARLELAVFSIERRANK